MLRTEVGKIVAAVAAVAAFLASLYLLDFDYPKQRKIGLADLQAVLGELCLGRGGAGGATASPLKTLALLLGKTNSFVGENWAILTKAIMSFNDEIRAHLYKAKNFHLQDLLATLIITGKKLK